MWRTASIPATCLRSPRTSRRYPFAVPKHQDLKPTLLPTLSTGRRSSRGGPHVHFSTGGSLRRLVEIAQTSDTAVPTSTRRAHQGCEATSRRYDSPFLCRTTTPFQQTETRVRRRGPGAPRAHSYFERREERTCHDLGLGRSARPGVLLAAHTPSERLTWPNATSSHRLCRARPPHVTST